MVLMNVNYLLNVVFIRLMRRIFTHIKFLFVQRNDEYIGDKVRHTDL